MVDTKVTISIHAAHAGCDLRFDNFALASLVFQSTQPMRAATEAAYEKVKKESISIHAAHAGCDKLHQKVYYIITISIHAAHAGCDLKRRLDNMIAKISIHAAHAGCDFFVPNRLVWEH